MIEKKELARWWMMNAVKLVVLCIAFYVVWLSFKSIGILDTTDKYNLSPKPVCAPESLNGKTVINCLNK